jgi:hypothetical protein
LGHPHLVPPPQNVCNREQHNTIFCGVKGNFEAPLQPNTNWAPGGLAALFYLEKG